MKCENCTTNTSFINNYFSFKFSNDLSYLLWRITCAQVKKPIFLQCYKWGRHFGRLSSMKHFVWREQRNYCDQHTFKNWTFGQSANFRLNQLNPVGTWAGICFMVMRLAEFKIFSFWILGGETIPPMKCKNYTTITSFINTYYIFKFLNGLSYCLWCIICAKV